MKFNCGPTYAEERVAARKWHRVFAWSPVRIASGDCRWLEWVERRTRRTEYGGGEAPYIHYWDGAYEYRPLS